MRKLFSILAILPLAVLPAFSGAAAPGEADHTVQVGALNPENPLAPYAYTDFYPRTLELYQGQTVEWQFPNVGGDIQRAFHTVSFLPAGHPDYFRPDELDGSAAFTEGVWATSPGCDRFTGAGCVVNDTSTVVSSGVPIGATAEDGSIRPFYATINLEPRDEPYMYHCTIHRQMHGYLKVKPAGEPLVNPSAAEIADRIQTQTDEADALRAERSKPRFDVVDGRRIWTVTAGDMTSPRPATPGARVQDGGVLILGFMPAELPIARGDGVRFEVLDELHTVTFPDPIEQFDPSFAPTCDADGATTGAPGVPGIICPPGWSAEVVVTPGASELRAPDDAVTRTSVHHSGLMTAADAPSWQRNLPSSPSGTTASVFDAYFPDAGRFGYRCQIHVPFMTGGISVN